ncbi:GIY-YIG nuclease family protein [Streptomyces violaceusniger]|uniref:GIY-YIG nuclease family protein n=1 Tax=Streptomyces violaceusniger TaxID=68280 RepID=UPI003444F6F3
MNVYSTEEPGYDTSVSPEQESELLPCVAKRRESVKVPTTYLVGMEGSPLVKIGFTSGDPKKRLASLQTGQPMKLSLLWSSEGNHESALHHRFAPHRVRGEWFDLTPLGDPVQVVEDAILPGRGLNCSEAGDAGPSERRAEADRGCTRLCLRAQQEPSPLQQLHGGGLGGMA